MILYYINKLGPVTDIQTDTHCASTRFNQNFISSGTGSKNWCALSF